MPRELAFFGLCFLALVLAAELKLDRRDAPADPDPMPRGGIPTLPTADTSDAPPRALALSDG